MAIAAIFEARYRPMRTTAQGVAKPSEKTTASAALQPASAATKITPQAGGKPVLTDGPFGETREVVTGFYSFTTSSPEQARELASMIPTEGWLELFPVLVLDSVR